VPIPIVKHAAKPVATEDERLAFGLLAKCRVRGLSREASRMARFARLWPSRLLRIVSSGAGHFFWRLEMTERVQQGEVVENLEASAHDQRQNRETRSSIEVRQM
jgi:hypothetical protein